VAGKHISAMCDVVADVCAIFNQQRVDFQPEHGMAWHGISVPPALFLRSNCTKSLAEGGSGPHPPGNIRAPETP